jgi:hypothetical protein
LAEQSSGGPGGVAGPPDLPPHEGWRRDGRWDLHTACARRERLERTLKTSVRFGRTRRPATLRWQDQAESPIPTPAARCTQRVDLRRSGSSPRHSVGVLTRALRIPLRSTRRLWVSYISSRTRSHLPCISIQRIAMSLSTTGISARRIRECFVRGRRRFHRRQSTNEILNTP